MHQVGRFIFATHLQLGGSIRTDSVVELVVRNLTIFQYRATLVNGLLIKSISHHKNIWNTRVVQQKTDRVWKDHQSTRLHAKRPDKFMKDAKVYAEKSRIPIAESMTGANMANQFEMIITNIQSMYGLACTMQKRYSQFLTHLNSVFPQAAKGIAFGQGKTMERHGELIILYDCLKVTDFDVIWTRRVNNKCFKDFPVTYNGTIKFLQLMSRDLVDFSPLIKCEEIPKVTFVKRSDSSYASINQNGSLSSSDIKFPKHHWTKTSYLHDMSWDFENDTKRQAPINSILHLVKKSFSDLEDLNVLRTKGSVTAGIVSDIGGIFRGVADGADSVIGEIGETLGSLFGDVSDGSSEVIDSITQGTSGVIDSTGNALGKLLPNAILWAIVITEMVCIIYGIIALRKFRLAIKILDRAQGCN